jgi:CheY-like chemotaxis protein
MQPVGILVIEEGAEAALMCAALLKTSHVRVLDAPDVRGALERLKTQRAALAIVGADALADVRQLHSRGIPVVAVVSELPSAARERALAAGVREIHERPTNWRAYSELIESLVSRFIRPN